MSTTSDGGQQQQQEKEQQMQPEKTLNRKSSKSRLAKQNEIECEEPPSSDKSKLSVAGVSAAGVGDASSSSLSPDYLQTTSKVAMAEEGQELKMLIPETRVESFDELCSDDEKNLPNKGSKHLVRSHALCGDDDTKLNARGIEKQGSSKSSAASSLSRDSSNELYTDSTGINLEDFIVNTLHKNPRDREMLLQLEEDLAKFVLDSNKQVYRFPSMSSYNRMLVHRISAFFGLDHNVDQSGTAVVVTKSKVSRLPEAKFKDYIKGDVFSEEVKRVLRRDAQSYEETRSDQSIDLRKVRSFDEREEHYQQARARIFAQDSSSSAEGVIESPISEGVLMARPWSSTESSSEGGGHASMIRQPHFMQKAYSYGGSPVYYRNEAPSKRLGAAPPDVTRENVSATGIQRAPILEVQHQYYPSNPPVLVAVPSLAQVPPGAVFIHPATGYPYLNPDGSVYRHDMAAGSAGPPSPASASHFSGSPVPNVPPCAMPSLAVQDSSGGVAGHFQQMNIHSTTPVSAGGEPAAVAAAPVAPPHSAVYMNPQWGMPRVVTYVVPQQQGMESDGQSPVLSASHPVLMPNPLCMQPAPLQYQSSIPYAYSQGPAVYTQTQGCPSVPTQVSYSQSATPMSSTLYYPGVQQQQLHPSATVYSMPAPRLHGGTFPPAEPPGSDLTLLQQASSAATCYGAAIVDAGSQQEYTGEEQKPVSPIVSKS